MIGSGHVHCTEGVHICCVPQSLRCEYQELWKRRGAWLSQPEMKTGKNQLNFLEELGLGLTGIEGEEGTQGRKDNEMMVLQVIVTGLSLSFLSAFSHSDVQL